jgi:hypothetical protein
LFLPGPDEEWSTIKPDVYGSIMDFFSTGKPIIMEQTTLRPNIEAELQDPEIVQMIKELLDTRIRPVCYFVWVCQKTHTIQILHLAE